MKVLFLDFDGVLNSHRFMLERVEGSLTSGNRPIGVMGIDPKAVAHVNYICGKTGAMIVVSSSWRYGHTLGELKDILREAGFTGTVRDRTPFTHEIANDRMLTLFDKIGLKDATPDRVKRALTDPDALISIAGTRGQEIDAWLRTWSEVEDIESFVVLDDDSDIAPHADRHVKTMFAEGLTSEHVPLALEILSRPWVRA